jgi:hypothetical protein
MPLTCDFSLLFSPHMRFLLIVRGAPAGHLIIQRLILLDLIFELLLHILQELDDWGGGSESLSSK